MAAKSGDEVIEGIKGFRPKLLSIDDQIHLLFPLCKGCYNIEEHKDIEFLPLVIDPEVDVLFGFGLVATCESESKVEEFLNSIVSINVVLETSTLFKFENSGSLLYRMCKSIDGVIRYSRPFDSDMKSKLRETSVTFILSRLFWEPECPILPSIHDLTNIRIEIRFSPQPAYGRKFTSVIQSYSRDGDNYSNTNFTNGRIFGIHLSNMNKVESIIKSLYKTPAWLMCYNWQMSDYRLKIFTPDTIGKGLRRLTIDVDKGTRQMILRIVHTGTPSGVASLMIMDPFDVQSIELNAITGDGSANRYYNLDMMNEENNCYLNGFCATRNYLTQFMILMIRYLPRDLANMVKMYSVPADNLDLIARMNEYSFPMNRFAGNTITVSLHSTDRRLSKIGDYKIEVLQKISRMCESSPDYHWVSADDIRKARYRNRRTTRSRLDTWAEFEDEYEVADGYCTMHWH